MNWQASRQQQPVREWELVEPPPPHHLASPFNDHKHPTTAAACGGRLKIERALANAIDDAIFRNWQAVGKKEAD
jgi:hypothetical protein